MGIDSRIDSAYGAQIEREHEIREAEKVQARLVVAGKAHNADDCRLLLDALGLLR